MTREEEIKQQAMSVIGVPPELSLLECFRIGFKEGAKWADEHPNSNGKELLYVAQNTAERTKKEIINKACNWLQQHEEMIGISLDDYFIERFKEAMKE